MSVFLGVGLGPIQTGIFLLGAARGGFDKLVIAEVDETLKNAVNLGGGAVTINVAGEKAVHREAMSGVRALNPANPADLAELTNLAAEADEIATALPSVDIFPAVAKWLGPGLEKNPNKTRFVYTAENNNHAAELFRDALGDRFPNIHYLNTVVGKMSGVVSGSDCDERGLAQLCPEADRGHLVEEFNNILISSCPGIDDRRVAGLSVKEDLYPFEEAKLYGHNAIHLLLGLLGKRAGKTFMSEIAELPEAMAFAESAFIEESGAALCRKWKGVDDLFTTAGFTTYAKDLLKRMVNPFLNDAIARITRDPARKLGWSDRIIGTMRLALDQGVRPEKLAEGAALATRDLCGENPDKARSDLASLWPSPWTDEHETVFSLIKEASRVA